MRPEGTGSLKAAVVQQGLTPDCERPAVGRREPAAAQDLAEPEEAR